MGSRAAQSPFRLDLVCCGCGVVRTRRLGAGSATGEAVTVGGFDDEAGSDHGGEAFVESGGGNAAGCPQFGERRWLLAADEGCGDALIDGSWFDMMLWRVIGLSRLEGKGVAALDQFKRDAWHGGSGTMLDGQDDTIVERGETDGASRTDTFEAAADDVRSVLEFHAAGSAGGLSPPAAHR